jgi:hypothetical protein
MAAAKETASILWYGKPVFQKVILQPHVVAIRRLFFKINFWHHPVHKAYGGFTIIEAI